MARVSLIDWRVAAKLQSIKNSQGLGKFGAEEMGRIMNPYVPMQDGALSENYVTEPFATIYIMIYAAYQYNGTGFNFSREKHPLATSQWDKAAFPKHTPELAQSLTDYIKRL